MSPTGTYTVGRDSIIVLCKGGRLPSWHDLTQASATRTGRNTSI